MLAQHWLSPLRLPAQAFGGVALAECLVALCLMFLAGVAAGTSFALMPYFNRKSAGPAHANGAIAQLGNLGSSSGPPLFAVLRSHFGTVSTVLPVMVFGLAEMVLAL